MRIVGLLELMQSIYCKYEVLGKSVYTRISGVDVGISFPRSDFDFCNANDYLYIGNSDTLLPPDIAVRWEQDGESSKWGYLCSYADKDAVVNRLALSVECDDDDVFDTAQVLHDTINMWETAFVQYCILSSGQIFEKGAASCDRNLYLWDNHGCIPTSKPITVKMSLRLPNAKTFLTLHQIEKAIEFASTGKELHLEYQLLLAAYKARNNGQNRQAIVDACSALELCCVNRIIDFCNEHTISADILLNKYRSLGERLDLVGKIDKAFQLHQIKGVVAIRNKLIHNSNVFPSNEEARTVIRQVESWLQLYFDDFYDKCKTQEVFKDQL